MPVVEPLSAATLRQQRTAQLQAAAARKQKEAVERAEAALRRLIKGGEPINFRTVAQAGSVSVNFLYNNQQLRSRIDHLRAQQQQNRRSPCGREPSGDQAIIRALTAKLSAERRHHHDEIVDLKRALAAAHGEILALRRSLQPSQKTLQPPVVEDASSAT